MERRWRQTVDAGEAAAVLKAEVDYLKQLEPEGEKESPANLVDIYYNAERCFARAAYADTLARFWRIYEGAVYYWLRERWGVEPRDLYQSRDAGNRDRILQALGGRAELGGQLNLFLANKLLHRELGDEVFARIGETPVKARRAASWQEMKLSALLEELRRKRNSSVVAHGMKPVSEEDAANSLAAARVLLARVLPGGEDLLASYPLQQPHINVLVDLLAAG